MIKRVTKVKQFMCANYPDLFCAFEFRHSSWYDNSFHTIITPIFSGNFCMVISHCFNSYEGLDAGFHIGVINPQITYLRMHGTASFSSGTYHPKFIKTLLEKFAYTKTLLIYFNNVDTVEITNIDSVDCDTFIPSRQIFTKAFAPVGQNLLSSALLNAKCVQQFVDQPL